MMSKYHKVVLFLSVIFFSACLKKPLPPPIGNNLSYPGTLFAFNSTDFLLLNTDANGDYADGSIQRYHVDVGGGYALQNVVSVSPHGSELAVSPDSKLVALSFDTSQSPTQLQFYNYTNSSLPALLPQLTLSFVGAGGKQTVKNLRFFTPTTVGVPADASNYYYLYGTILSYPTDTSGGLNIPARTFVAKIAKDFSSSRILFTLSSGVGDPNSLAKKSDSLNQSVTSTQYMFGFDAPTYDAAHDILLAFPTGSMNGYNNQGTNIFPPMPDAMSYFSGQPAGNTNQNCGSTGTCIQPDFRVVSAAAIDFVAILNNEPLNNSSYFIPMGWNKNGIPYAAVTNGINLIFPVNSGNVDSNSFEFQTKFWSSYWANTDSNCYLNTITNAINQYQLTSSNGLLLAKNGTNGNGDGGNGNEVFIVTGLDKLKSNIASIRTARGGINPAGESDFKSIASYQMIDPYNVVPAVPASWLNGASGTRNAGPLTPYMYSRTTDVGGFNSTPTAVSDMGVLNFGSNTCTPFWVRNTYGGVGSLGMDSAWVGTSPNLGNNGTYPNALADPTNPWNYPFPWGTGAQRCVSVKPTSTPYVFCANFLTSEITRFSTTNTVPVLNPF